jgi:hypothetical protein
LTEIKTGSAFSRLIEKHLSEDIAARERLAVLSASAREQLPTFVHEPMFAFVEECRQSDFPSSVTVSGSLHGKRILDLDPCHRIGVALHAYNQIIEIYSYRRIDYTMHGVEDGWRTLVSHLLKSALSLTTADLIRLVSLMRSSTGYSGVTNFYESPGPAIIRAIERVAAANGLVPEVAVEIRALLKAISDAGPQLPDTKPVRLMRERLEKLVEVPAVIDDPAAKLQAEREMQALEFTRNWLPQVLRLDYRENLTPEAFEEQVRLHVARTGVDAVLHQRQQEERVLHRAEAVEMSIAFYRQCERDLPVAVFEGIGAYVYDDKLRGSTLGKHQLLALSSSDKITAIIYLYVELAALEASKAASARAYSLSQDLSEATAALLASKLSFTEAQLVVLTNAAARYQFGSTRADAPLVKKLEQFAANQRPSALLLQAIRTLCAVTIKRTDDKATRGLHDRLAAMLQPSTSSFRLSRDLWSDGIEVDIARLPEARQAALRDLLAHAAKSKGAKPKTGWLTAAGKLAKGRDRAKLAECLLAWVTRLDPDALLAQSSAPSGRERRLLERQAWRLPSHHGEVARGLIWLAALLGGERIAPQLTAIALHASKVWHAEYGAPLIIVFNGAVQALTLLPKSAGAPQLTALRRKMKSLGDQATVDKALSTLAANAGTSVANLEEQSVPDYGLDMSGYVELPAGNGSARIAITGATSSALSWFNSKGLPAKSAPKPVDSKQKNEIAAAKTRAKDVGEALKSHASRLERLYLTQHSWPFDVWQQTYLSHPVLGHLARSLVWSFESGGKTQLGLPHREGVDGVEGKPLTFAANTVVRLWHPITSPASEVLAWRRRIVGLGVTQPLKQAYREVYLVTDAERRTGTYSNRFAAHILRQHQFRALGKQRGWRIPLEGYWDVLECSRRVLPEFGLVVEFLTSGVDETMAGDGGPYGAFALVATDRLRFLNSHQEVLRIDEVPPIALSEMMRDVDLFVGVASVGNDANWVDQGENHPLQTYWSRTAFGALSGSASSRKDVLTDILPMLSIAQQCHLDERYLIVDGRLRTYRIHLGSGNILMEPNSQYLCIVPGRGTGETRTVQLPFEGDVMLSIILSKAFMLAEDDTITDPTITSQIARAR